MADPDEERTAAERARERHGEQVALTAAQRELLREAAAARDRAHAPDSDYPVGVALDTDVGTFTGANVETPARVASLHGEMVAAYRAALGGAQEFRQLAVSPEGESGVAICGLCQHAVSQFCADDVAVVEDVGRDDEAVVYSLDELTEHQYTPSTRHGATVGGGDATDGRGPPQGAADADPVELARAGRDRSFVPYTDIPVGASVVTDEGVYWAGDVEVSGRSTTAHAATLATQFALLDGATTVETVVVSAAERTGGPVCGHRRDDESDAPVCGTCQDAVAALSGDATVHVEAGGADEFETHALEDLRDPTDRARSVAGGLSRLVGTLAARLDGSDGERPPEQSRVDSDPDGVSRGTDRGN